MQTFTASEFFDFIKAQPDDKSIDMYQDSLAAPCGCLLVQFARHKGLTKGYAGMCQIYISNSSNEVLLPVAEDRELVSNVVSRAIYDRPENYGQIKHLLP